MNIEIQQPQPFDLVSSDILIAGNAVGFEGQLSINITEGHAEANGTATVGATSVRQFQTSIDVPPGTPFQLTRLFLTLADDTGGEDGVTPPQVTVPILYGPMILPGYTGYWNHVVEAGDTLTAISKRYFGDASKVSVIQQANQHIVPDANLIFVDQVLRIPRND
ncbi:MAG: LysM peptidoglycan-binding domain-containing protein [Ahrensia sp.]|nr:LysM peptidoglycan-binding domain-containing protein [Ahrensia sp.]